jgi:hypothetical protein
MKDEEWVAFERKVRRLIRLSLVDSKLLNIYEEKTSSTTMRFVLYSKSLVNNFFLQKKVFALRMDEGDFVVEHLNVFITIMT